MKSKSFIRLWASRTKIDCCYCAPAGTSLNSHPDNPVPREWIVSLFFLFELENSLISRSGNECNNLFLLCSKEQPAVFVFKIIIIFLTIGIVVFLVPQGNQFVVRIHTLDFIFKGIDTVEPMLFGLGLW